MNQHDKRTYLTLIGLLLLANACLIAAIASVGWEQRHQCERDGHTQLNGKAFDCQEYKVR